MSEVWFECCATSAINACEMTILEAFEFGYTTRDEIKLHGRDATGYLFSVGLTFVWVINKDFCTLFKPV